MNSTEPPTMPSGDVRDTYKAPGYIGPETPMAGVTGLPTVGVDVGNPSPSDEAIGQENGPTDANRGWTGKPLPPVPVDRGFSGSSTPPVRPSGPINPGAV